MYNCIKHLVNYFLEQDLILEFLFKFGTITVNKMLIERQQYNTNIYTFLII